METSSHRGESMRVKLMQAGLKVFRGLGIQRRIVAHIKLTGSRMLEITR
jgi:hypothetical protein